LSIGRLGSPPPFSALFIAILGHRYRGNKWEVDFYLEVNSSSPKSFALSYDQSVQFFIGLPRPKRIYGKL